MKKIFLFFFLFAFATGASAQTRYYDFSAVCESGQTLYYLIRSNNQVSVSPPGVGNWNGYTKPIGDLVIPEEVEYDGVIYTVRDIWYYSFYECTELISVVIPNSVTNIYQYSFCGCTSLSSIVIGASVNTIDHYAFRCPNLQTIYCLAQDPPTCDYYSSNNCNFFQDTPDDIPLHVSCLSIDRYQSHPNWSRFTNIIGEFNGVASLTVSVNNPEAGNVEIVSLPEDCDNLNATVLATPFPGHSFGYWKNGYTVVSTQAEYSFALNTATHLTAYFDIPSIYDSIAIPDHVIGQKLNIFDEVTYEYPSDFIYNDNGILRYYQFPGQCQSTYTFTKFPNMPSYIYISLGNHPSSEEFVFNYDSFDKIIHSRDVWSDVYDNKYYDYYYDNNHKLIKKEYSDDDGIYSRYIYSYENGNRTRIDSIFSGGYNNLRLYYITTNHYNARQQVLTAQTDSYNASGEMTASSLKTYSYTANHKTDSIITQSLSNYTWVNSAVAHYVYDDKNRVVEYQTGSWVADSNAWNITKKILYNFDDDEQVLTVTFRKKNDEGEWVRDVFNGQTVFYDSKLYEWQRALRYYNSYSVNQFVFDLHYMTIEESFPRLSEWYYTLEWDDGTVTYQHLKAENDTTINNERPTVIVRSNTQYDRDEYIEVTHEYILEEGNVVYWWNKDIEEFTTLYDYNAEAGDEWEIKVGTESITVHVDSVGIFEYDGETRKMLHISDAGNIFNGDIVVGYGHMTSFFPEKLMNRSASYTVDGLRCYWVEDALLYHNGDEDCDAIYSEIHNVDAYETEVFAVYPNPTNGVLFVETQSIASLPDPTYRITNLVGQTVVSGSINAKKQQINIKKLPTGMYFITLGGQTVKFVVK